MRVLHLIDSPGRTGLCATLGLIADVLVAAARAGAGPCESIVLGGACDERLARACGLRPLGHLAPPRLWSDSGWRSLDRCLEGWRRAGRAPRILHAWGAWSAAVIGAVPGDHVRVLSLTASPSEGWERALRALPEDRRPARILLASDALRRASGGASSGDGLLLLLPPALDGGRLDPFPRSAVRARWRVGDDTVVLGLLGEPAAWSDARFAAVAVHRLALSGRRIALLVPASCGNRAAAQHLVRDAGRPGLLLIDDALLMPWAVVRGLDGCIFAPRPGPARDGGLLPLGGAGRCDRAVASAIPVLWAMAAGVPVVAARSAAAAGAHELIEDGESGLLFGERDLNDACRQIARLLDDRALAGRLVAEAARRAEAFAPPRSAQALEATYARLF